VVTSGVKLDHWCRESLYEEYVLNLIKNEPVEVALQRSVMHMTDWANNHDSVWNHYFLYVSTNRVTFDIKDGKISPWLLLNSENGRKLLSTLSEEQLVSIGTTIDPDFWFKKFRTMPDDADFARQIIKESNL
jgi:hypothetical protein